LTPEELLAIAFKRPLLFAPGKEYDYCNTNYESQHQLNAGLTAARSLGAVCMRDRKKIRFSFLPIRFS
jgi:hypothetical protein